MSGIRVDVNEKVITTAEAGAGAVDSTSICVSAASRWVDARMQTAPETVCRSVSCWPAPPWRRPIPWSAGPVRR